MIRLMDYPTTKHEFEVFVGADRVVRINIDGECALRAKLGPDAQLVVRGHAALVNHDPTEST